MSSLRWSLLTLLIIVAGLSVQFFAFRQSSIFDICLKTHLYDHVWWVDRPAKHLILGSSNAMNGIIPNLIAQIQGKPKDHVLNLGMNGGTPFSMLRNLELYVDKFPFPERIDIVLTPAMIQEYYLVEKDYEKIWLSKQQWDIIEDEKKIANSYFFPAMIFWQACRFDSRHIFLEYHYNLQTTRERRGFQPNYEKIYQFEFKPLLLPQVKKHFSWSEQQLDALKRIQDLSTANNATVNYLITPIHPELFKAYQNSVTLNEPNGLPKLEKQLKARLGDIQVEGSLSPHDFHLKHEHFINGDHLTFNGARIFTTALYQFPKQHRHPLKFITKNTRATMEDGQ